MEKSKAILALLVINIATMLYIGYTINAKIQRNDNLTMSNYQSIQQQVNQLENRIVSFISQELIKQTDKVERLEYTLTEADLIQKKVKVNLQVALKEVSSSSVVAVSLWHDGQSEPQEVVLAEQGGLTYGTDKLELSLEHNYELTILERSAEGQKQLNAEVHILPLFDNMYRNRVLKESTGTGMSNERMNVDFSFVLMDLKIPGIELEQALLRIKKDGVVYDEIDVTEQATPRNSKDVAFENMYMLARASGQIDSSVTLEQFARDQNYNPNEYVPTDTAKVGESESYAEYSLLYTIEFGNDYPELKLNQESANQLSFEWVLKFKDGYEFVR